MKKIILSLCLIVWLSVGFAQVKSTSYSGSIDGYSLSWGYNTGKLIVHNVVTGIDELYIIEISPDGTFHTNFPLRAPKECYITFPLFSGYVYFEPGDHVIQQFDVSDAAQVSSSFLGDQKTVNNGLYKARDVIRLDWDEIYAAVLNMEPGPYKAYFKAMENQALKQLGHFSDEGILNEKAYRLASNTVRYDIASQLMQYNWNREYAYRKINKISFNSRAREREEVKLEMSYYDFLNDINYNDPENLKSGYYGVFLNRIKFLDVIYDKADVHDLSVEIKHLEAQDTLSKDWEERLRFLKDAVKNNRKIMTPGSFEKARVIVLTNLIDKDISLELELMEIQDICQNMDLNKMPLSDSTMAGIKSKINNDFLLDYVQDLNNSLQEVIAKNTKQTGYVNNPTPDSDSDSLFNSIISKYKGKVVFVDFWATWCSPCLAGIKEMASMKEDLQNEEIIFLYITNDSSPINAYNILIPGIKGEHYRLSNDEFNRLSAQFSIVGIPHYSLVNRDGHVVDKNYKWQNAEQVKNTLL